MSGVLSELAYGVKRLQKLSKDLSDLELREAVIEQRELLISAREEIILLRETVSDLKKCLKSLEDQSVRLDQTIDVDGFRYDLKERDPIGLPYCPKCEVSDGGKLFRLSRQNDFFSTCPNCHNVFNAGKNGLVNVQPNWNSQAEIYDPFEDPYS